MPPSLNKMIEYEQFTLDNGLHVIVHQDKSTTLAAINILYDVGSRDEKESKTGFAHLFEHLMFGGSRHIENYDEILQKVGGENNAFTTPDITNYYMTLPAANLETGFWLESDRMLSLSFDPEVLEVQRKVVIEEFKQRYLNQPYGDAWLKLRPLAYKVHSYKWATIGKDISHIEKATMEDVRDFFYQFYTPNNAVLVVAGNVELEQVKQLSEKYFGSIPMGSGHSRNLLQEPTQNEARYLTVDADVPIDALYKVFHMPSRSSDLYQTADLMSDLIGRGKSSRLYKRLVKEEKVLSSINAYVTGSLDPGLIVISGKLNEDTSMERADQEINAVLDDFIRSGPEDQELQKVKNQALTSVVFGEVELLNRAMNLAVGWVMGDPSWSNGERERIEKVSISDIQTLSKTILREDNCSSLYYKSKAA